jgi:hypothetical protein
MPVSFASIVQNHNRKGTHRVPCKPDRPFRCGPDPVVAAVPKSAMDEAIAFVIDLLAGAANSEPI